MKIQIWRRKNYTQNKYNLYIRYRVNQNKAKVESLKLWEWISPNSDIEKKHNEEVKIAYQEIIRRTKDDIENGRSNIIFEDSNNYSFKNSFFRFSNIKNTNAVFNFIKSQNEEIETLKLSDINQKFFSETKKLIEDAIKSNELNGSTASKYWNNFKSVIKNINKNKLCEYPKVSGIKYKKKEKINNTFTLNDLEKFKKIKSEQNEELINAFLFTCATGMKLSILRKLKWKEIIKNDNNNYYAHIKNRDRIIPFDKITRKILGKRKNDKNNVFLIDEQKSNTTKTFLKLLKKAEIDNTKKYNDGINTFAKNMYEKTKNIYFISAILGHNSIIKTKERYPYMNETDSFKNYFNLTLPQEKNIEKKISKPLFKKGNLLSYKKDTL